MTSKHQNSSSARRYPLKRVRPDNENQESILSSTEQSNKKLRRQSSADSAFVESEKSSDERAFDLFHNEYFLQFRPYFKHRSIAGQFVEHLWSNMTEQGKVSFVKKILKEQGIYDLSSRNFSDSDTFSNDENDAQLSRSMNEMPGNVPTWNANSRYSRSFINDLLSYMKHSITPRFVDKKSSAKVAMPLRRSSRIRRAPSKCACSTCVTTGSTEEHSSVTTTITDDSEYRVFRHLIDHYHRLDDQFTNISISSLSTDDPTVDDTNLQSIDMPLSEINESSINIPSPPLTVPAIPDINDTVPLPSSDLSMDMPVISQEKLPSERPTRRTYVILTELDEPFFGPYPIEFTITI